MAGAMGDIAGLGVTLGAMGGVMNMTRDAMRPMVDLGAQVGQTAGADGTTWDCPGCSTKAISSRFCPNCGAKKPEAAPGWNCPDCGTQNITSAFCPNCGRKNPEAAPGWNCPDCGTQNISSNFCPNCGRKRGE